MPDLIRVTPIDSQVDPVGKIRVSQPQALIDTDFEYGQQPTKWESIGLQNNRPSTYFISQAPRNVTAVTGDGTSRTVVVSMADTSGFSVGTPIFVQNSNSAVANGWYLVSAVSAGVSVSYVASAIVASGNQFNSTQTYVYLGFFYTSCGIQVGTTAITNVSTVCTATTTGPHGLSAGSLIYVTGTTASTNPPNGAWVVSTVPTANTFTFSVVTAPTGTINNSSGTSTIFARSSGYVEPRTFDGGVAFSAGSTVPNQQLIRQTRRYFRYQSGKGIQFSTGSCLNPSIFVTSITAVGTIATVTTRYQHSLAAGATIRVVNADQSQYNGTFRIASVTGANTFTYVMLTAPTVTTATGVFIRVSPINWFGSSVRVGLLDQQNGMFFEYDGQVLYAVYRTSINQLAGTVTVTQGSGSVTGTGTQFSTQLIPGDFIVIRGQTYSVVSIASDTSMFISPEYRGTTISSPSGAIVSKTIDTRVPQSQWLDPCNGTGASGYNLDLTRMQMWYIDYSWYGAGFIRWGLRATGGQIVYVYNQVNNNVRYEAFMRSGNLPAHYESNGITPQTILTSTLASGTGAGGVINVASTSGFAPAGLLKVQNAGSSGTIEYITYSSITATTFVIAARAQTGGQGSAQTFTYSATAPIGVEFASPDTAAALAHWGSSVIMDGNFNDDKSLVFNFGTTQPLVIPASNTVPVLAVRIAPAADNGTTGLLGSKEIINRVQLQLQDMAVVSNNAVLVNLVLNGFCTNFSGSFQSIATGTQVSSSLAQVAINTNALANIASGESVTAFYSNGVNSIDLGNVRDLGNSILGGGTANTVPTSQSAMYPDGPDVLYIVATNTSNTAPVSLLSRINWKEAQA